MKKLMASLALAAISFTLVCSPAISKDCSSGEKAIRLMERYGAERGVEYLKIGSFLMGIAKTFAPGDKGEIMEYLDHMAIFSAEDAPAAVQERFFRELDSTMKGYQKLIEARDGEDDMTIYFLNKDEKTISQLMLVTRSDAAVIYMCGEIPVDVLKKMIEE